MALLTRLCECHISDISRSKILTFILCLIVDAVKKSRDVNDRILVVRMTGGLLAAFAVDSHDGASLRDLITRRYVTASRNRCAAT